MKKIFLNVKICCLFGLFFSGLAFSSETYFVYTKFAEVNLRVGPGTTYPINWVIQYKGEPLEVSHKMDNWLKCKDFNGDDGWVQVSSVSRRNPHVVIKSPQKKYIIVYVRADESSKRLFRVESGRRSKLKKCNDKWCKISIDNQDAWVLREYVWGAP